MDFKLDEADIRALAQIEAEAGCDISAGADWSTRLGDDLALLQKPVDQQKLIALLHEDLGELLSPDEVVAIANDFQNHIHQRLLLIRQQRLST